MNMKKMKLTMRGHPGRQPQPRVGRKSRPVREKTPKEPQLPRGVTWWT